jgi:hypothetical protein
VGGATLFLLDAEPEGGARGSGTGSRAVDVSIPARLTQTASTTPNTLVTNAIAGSSIVYGFLSPADLPLYGITAGAWTATVVTSATAALNGRLIAQVMASDGTTVLEPLLGRTATFRIPVASTTTTVTLAVRAVPPGIFPDVACRIRLQLEVINPGSSTQVLTLYVQGDTQPSRVLTTAVIIPPETLPSGTNYSDYLYWDPAAGGGGGAWAVGNTQLHLGASAGASLQGSRAVALGTTAGFYSQGNDAVAVGYNCGTWTQGTAAVAVGPGAGYTAQEQFAVAVGSDAGYNLQKSAAVAVGAAAGNSRQGNGAVAVGPNAGQNTQGASAVAVGAQAGFVNQSTLAVAVGTGAGNYYQRNNAVAVGTNAGQTYQGLSSVAVGSFSGFLNQGDSAVAIGDSTAYSFQAPYSVCVGPSNIVQGVTGAVVIGREINLTSVAGATSCGAVVLNGSNAALTIPPLSWSSGITAGFWVTPVRGVTAGQIGGLSSVLYDAATKEFVYLI